MVSVQCGHNVRGETTTPERLEQQLSCSAVGVMGQEIGKCVSGKDKGRKIRLIGRNRVIALMPKVPNPKPACLLRGPGASAGNIAYDFQWPLIIGNIARIRVSSSHLLEHGPADAYALCNGHQTANLRPGAHKPASHSA